MLLQVMLDKKKSMKNINKLISWNLKESCK
jgi:hypothetical protein